MAAKDAIFHIEVARATGNPVLEAVMRMIRADRDYSPELERMINASSVNNPSDHLNIFLAIEERKPDKARDDGKITNLGKIGHRTLPLSNRINARVCSFNW